MENRNIIYYKQIDSTNTQATRLALEGAAHGTVVVAKEQTAGKGRRGRCWESPAGENIYLSVLLRPELVPEKAPMLTLVMAYSVAKAMQKQGFHEIQIKWPNDLILSGKKVCGILTEMSLDGSSIAHVVVGVGVNVDNRTFPEELRGKATSLFIESGKPVAKEQLSEDIIRTFEEAYARFMEEKDLSFLQNEYNAMLVNCEKEVLVLEPGNEYTAYALGINRMGELLVRTAEGEEKAVFAGEVSVRGIYGYV